MCVLKKILLSTFVRSNELYALRRSFSESFKKFSFLFVTLLMASTWTESLFYMYFGHLHVFWSFFRCSWCLCVLKKILLSTFVASNELYTLTRSFLESFTKIPILFFTLLMASTLPQAHRGVQCHSSVEWPC